MKRLIVNEISFDVYEKWPNRSEYGKNGIYLCSCPGIPHFIVNVQDEAVLWGGDVSDSYFEKEEVIKEFTPEPVQSKVVSEDFALQMLSVALHKQKV